MGRPCKIKFLLCSKSSMTSCLTGAACGMPLQHLSGLLSYYFHSLTHTPPAGLVPLLCIPGPMHTLFPLSRMLFPSYLQGSLSYLLRSILTCCLLTEAFPSSALQTRTPSHPPCCPYLIFFSSTAFLIDCIFLIHFVYCLPLLRECGPQRAGICLSSICRVPSTEWCLTHSWCTKIGVRWIHGRCQGGRQDGNTRWASLKPEVQTRCPQRHFLWFAQYISKTLLVINS